MANVTAIMTVRTQLLTAALSFIGSILTICIVIAQFSRFYANCLIVTEARRMYARRNLK